MTFPLFKISKYDVYLYIQELFVVPKKQSLNEYIPVHRFKACIGHNSGNLRVFKRHSINCRKDSSKMETSTRRWIDGITLSDAVKNHIKSGHMFPPIQGKSCFLSSDETVVWKMVQDSFSHPDISKQHESKVNRVVLQKHFPAPVGIHGRNGSSCFFVTVIYDIADQRIITAFPTT